MKKFVVPPQDKQTPEQSPQFRCLACGPGSVVVSQSRPNDQAIKTYSLNCDCGATERVAVVWSEEANQWQEVPLPQT